MGKTGPGEGSLIFCKGMYFKEIAITYPKSKRAFCKKPVKAVAMANINVIMPKMACIGTMTERNL